MRMKEDVQEGKAPGHHPGGEEDRGDKPDR